MKYVILSGLFLCAISTAGSESTPVNSLPKPEDIFTIAINPIPSFPGQVHYFTADSLREALPSFRPGEAEIKAFGERRIWESGVIVLKDKKVFFWTTCRKNFIHVLTPIGHVSFIIGNGKDDL